jgi:hypothetical protein
MSIGIEEEWIALRSRFAMVAIACQHDLGVCFVLTSPPPSVSWISVIAVARVCSSLPVSLLLASSVYFRSA